MPLFQYTIKTSTGDFLKGNIEGENEHDVAQILLKKGLQPLAIEEVQLSNNILFQEKIPKLAALIFSQQMATLLKSGIPIMKALKGIQEATESKKVAQIIQEIRASLDSGHSFSSSLAKFPELFSDYYISMIKVGETSGKLEEIFLNLAEHLEFQRIMNAQIKAATRYPTIVISVMFIALGIINFFVIPAFAKVYTGFKSDLPIFTKILIGTSNFFINYSLIVFIIIAAIIGGFIYWKKTPEGGVKWGQIKLKLPIMGSLIHKATIARFLKSFALAIQAGVPIIQALQLVSETADNPWFEQQLSYIKNQLERGDGLYKACLQSGIFSPMALQMIMVGEESGAMDTMVLQVANLYQSEVEYQLKNISAQIEPILIVFLGVLVLILALGVFLPIWNLGSAVQGK